MGAGGEPGRSARSCSGPTNGGELRYVGNVGTGFDDAEIRKLLKALEPLRRTRSPFPVEPKLPRVRKGDVQWVEPRLVAQVRFGEWTHDGHLRHPSYLGLRDDKSADEVQLDEPLPEVIRKGKRELRLSNLDKPFWPDEGITKGDLLRYYQAVAPVLVPHLRDRPFTMRRYPDGAYGKAFFQKAAPSHMPDWIPTYRALVSTREGSRAKKWVDFPLVNDELAMLWMVNMGCIDMNSWYSRVDKPDRPDFVLFDLDPTPDVPWTQTVEVALILRDVLEALGLESFPKTSGGKGFHVLVPIDRALDVRGHSSLRGARRRRDRADASEARDDRVVEGTAPRCPDRLEPERRGQDDRIRLLGATEAARARVDAARLGRGERQAEPGDLHDGCGPRPRADERRPLRGCADDTAIADESAQAPGLTGWACAASFATVSSFPSITA